MKRLIFLVLLIPFILNAGPVQEAHKKVIAGSTIAGGVSCTYVVHETWNGATEDNTWTDYYGSGTWDDDYTTSCPEGAQCLRVGNAEARRVNFAGSASDNEWTITFIMEIEAGSGNNGYKFYLKDSSNNDLNYPDGMDFSWDGAEFDVTFAGSTSTLHPAPGETWYVKIVFDNGSLCELYLVEDSGGFPGWGSATISAAQGDADQLAVFAIYGKTSDYIKVDDIRIAESSIGASCFEY